VNGNKRLKVTEEKGKDSGKAAFGNEFSMYTNYFRQRDPVIRVSTRFSVYPFTFIVTSLPGKSLIDRIEEKKSEQVSEKEIRQSIIRWAGKMVKILRLMHERGIIHRNITPASFCFKGKDRDILIKDLEFATQFVHNGVHMPPKPEVLDPHMDREFKSANAHRGICQSRRDDMQSLALVLFSLFQPLPWDNKAAAGTSAGAASRFSGKSRGSSSSSGSSGGKKRKNKKKKRKLNQNQRLLLLKGRGTPEVLSVGLQGVGSIPTFFRRLLSLSFDEDPKYDDYLRYFGNESAQTPPPTPKNSSPARTEESYQEKKQSVKKQAKITLVAAMTKMTIAAANVKGGSESQPQTQTQQRSPSTSAATHQTPPSQAARVPGVGVGPVERMEQETENHSQSPSPSSDDVLEDYDESDESED
jgi:serine/threonine protein kinase